MNANVSWPDVATAIIAVYGAGLATYTLIADRREKRRVVVVKVTNAIPMFRTHAGAPIFLIEASNPGDRTVHIAGAGFKIRRRKGGFALFEPQSDVKFPHALEEGKSCRVWLESRSLALQLKKLGYSGKTPVVGYFQDATGTQYHSKPLKFDVEEWQKTPAG